MWCYSGALEQGPQSAASQFAKCHKSKPPDILLFPVLLGRTAYWCDGQVFTYPNVVYIPNINYMAYTASSLNSGFGGGLH